jgi:hypothetical protein
MRLAVKVPLLVLLGTLIAAGCAGARVQVRADRARYPLSLSPVVRDGTGRLHDARTLVKVGWLDVRQTTTGFVYSALPLPRERDFSDAINAQVVAAGGEAVVSLRISSGDGCGWLNGFPILNALPFWPGCVPVRLTGDIVRRRGDVILGP